MRDIRTAFIIISIEDTVGYSYGAAVILLPVLHSMRPLSDDFCFSALLIAPLSFTGLYLSSERGRQIPTIQRSAGKTGVNGLLFFVDKCVYISVSAGYFI